MSKKFLNVASSLNVHPPLPELRTLRYLRNRKHPPPHSHTHTVHMLKKPEKDDKGILYSIARNLIQRFTYSITNTNIVSCYEW
jgi:hypothetical protein